MIAQLLFISLCLGAHAAPEVCDGVIVGGIKSFGLKYDQYCEATSENILHTWPAGSVSSARECESKAIDSIDTKWYNYRSDGTCELLSYCECGTLQAEAGAVTGPDPGAGESCFIQEVLLVIGGLTPALSVGTVYIVREDLSVLSGVIPDAPVASYGWTAGLIDAEIVVCGGVFNGDECHHLNIETGTWGAVTNMATTRLGAASVVHDRGFFVFGGSTSGGLDTVEGYFASFDSWCDIPEWTMPEANFAFSVVEHNNSIYLTGGGGPVDGRAVRRLDTSTNVYEDLPSMAVPRESHASMVTTIGGREGILVTGGVEGGIYLSSTEFFSFSDQKWFSLPDLNFLRAFHGMAVFNGEAVVIGGYDGSTSYDHFEVYKEKEKKWEIVPGMLPVPTFFFASIQVPKYPL